MGIHFASGTRCRPNAEQNQDVLKLHPKLIFLIKIYFVCFFFLEKLQCSIILQLLTRHCYSWLSVLFFRKVSKLILLLLLLIMLIYLYLPSNHYNLSSALLLNLWKERYFYCTDELAIILKSWRICLSCYPHVLQLFRITRMFENLRNKAGYLIASFATVHQPHS